MQTTHSHTQKHSQGFWVGGGRSFVQDSYPSWRLFAPMWARHPCSPAATPPVILPKPLAPPRAEIAPSSAAFRIMTKCNLHLQRRLSVLRRRQAVGAEGRRQAAAAGWQARINFKLTVKLRGAFYVTSWLTFARKGIFFWLTREGINFWVKGYSF